MNNYAEMVTPATPKSQYIPREDVPNQITNHDGAYVFKLDCWKRLNRFLILGVDSSTYYQSQRDLVKENYQSLKDSLNEDFRRAIDMIVDVSINGKAPKNDSAVFALAVACLHKGNNDLSEADKANRNYAYSHVKSVCRIGTHLFMFLTYIRELKGKGKGTMGMGLQKAVIGYYEKKDLNGLAQDVLKYRNREGWSHTDVFKLIRWPANKQQQQIIDYVMKGESDLKVMPEIMSADVALKACKEDRDLVLALVQQHKIPWEIVPTEYLNDKEVLRALIPNMKATALIRNLSKLTSYGAIQDDPSCKYLKMVCDKLEDVGYIKAGKVHPMNLTISILAYEKGRSDLGSLTWMPIKRVIKALDVALDNSYANANKLNVRIEFALDVSPSMTDSHWKGIPASMLGSVLMTWLNKREDFLNTYVFAGGTGSFSRNTSYKKTSFSNGNFRDTWREIVNLRNSWGGTDCSLPIRDALTNKRVVDLFIIYTDNETNSSHSGHADQILAEYRRKVNSNAKMIVIGATATNCSIANPNDPGMMDVAGFDSSIAQIMESFVKGW